MTFQFRLFIINLSNQQGGIEMRLTRENLHQKLDWLASFSDKGPGVTRLLYTEAWYEARNSLIAYMEELGFDVREDAVGNVFGRIEGRSSSVILTGSHLDSVRSGGKYDGSYGVLAAIHSVYHIWKAHGTPEKTLEAAVFCEEEGSRFRTAYVGSRYVTGALTEDDLEAEDEKGISIRESLNAGSFTEPFCFEGRQDIERFLEIHIEQGLQLEQARESIGIAEAVVGQQRFTFRVTGKANHAGTTPMHLRCDALDAAAEMITAINEMTRKKGNPFVATVGSISASPGSVNVIPGDVTFTLDVRHPDDNELQLHVDNLQAACHRVAESHRTALDIRRFMTIEAVPMDASMCADLEEVCKTEEIPHRAMYSGAGHDAQVLGRRVPAALLFVPSQNGLSHHPEEYTHPDHLECGVNVLEKGLLKWAYKEVTS
jgi:allantoate deiminase